MKKAIFLAVLAQLLWIPAARAADPNGDPNDPDALLFGYYLSRVDLKRLVLGGHPAPR